MQSFQTLSLGWKDKLFQLDEVFLPCQHCETQDGLSKENRLTEVTPLNVQTVTVSVCSCDDSRFIIIGETKYN